MSGQARSNRNITMFISLTWCVPLCVALSLYRPILTCMSEARYFSTSPQRWLLFFVCFGLTVIPLHAVSACGYGLPLRWELTLVLITTYGYDDARGSQIVFLKFLSPLLTKGMAPLQSAVQTIYTVDPDSMLCTLRDEGAPTPPPPSPTIMTTDNGDDENDSTRITQTQRET